MAKAAQVFEPPWEWGRLAVQDEFVSDLLNPCQAYGGGWANGKTAGLLKKAFWLSYMFPKSHGLIARWDGKELRQTTMAEFRSAIPKALIDSSNDQRGEIVFKRKFGGSTIYYGDLKELRAINNYNLTWAAIDQAEEIDDERWDKLLGRTRRKTPMIGTDGPLKNPTTGEIATVPNYNFCTFNPEGRGTFLWRYFHPDSPELRPGYKLYQATTYDGLAARFITQDYVDKLLQALPEQARRRYMEGAWDAFHGRVYPEFSEDIHVIEPVRPDPGWIIYETIDWGVKNPTAVLWIAIDYDDNWIILDEHYQGGGKPVQYHAQMIKHKRAMLQQPVTMSILDSACWSENQSKGEHIYSIASEFGEYGIYPIPSTKKWDLAFSMITQRLMTDPIHTHPVTGKVGAPKLYVAKHCRHTIQEFVSYIWKKQRGTLIRNDPDVPVDYMDHSLDALAYFATTHPGAPKRHIVSHETPLEKWTKQRAAYNPLADTRLVGASWMGY